MDVLHCGYLDTLVSRLAATLPGRRASAADAISASEEEGLAMLPDGKSFIVTSGTQQSAIWLHDDKTGEKQITSEGYSFLPALSPMAGRYSLLAACYRFAFLLQRRAVGFPTSRGELPKGSLRFSRSRHFSISQDGKKNRVRDSNRAKSDRESGSAGLTARRRHGNLRSEANFALFSGGRGRSCIRELRSRRRSCVSTKTRRPGRGLEP